MKLNPLDSSLLTVIDKTQKVMDSLYKLTLTFCPDMIEQYALIKIRSSKLKREINDSLEQKHLLTQLSTLPFSKLLYEYGDDKWNLFNEAISDINSFEINGYERDVINPVNSDKGRDTSRNDNKVISSVFAGFLPNMELISYNGKQPYPPRMEIHRRYDPEIYSHLMNRNSFWNVPQDGTSPAFRNVSVNEDPTNPSIIQGSHNKNFLTNSQYEYVFNDHWLYEIGENNRMIIDIDSAIKGLACAFYLGYNKYVRSNVEEYNRILKEMIQSGMFPGLTQESSSYNEVDEDDLIKSDLDNLESSALTLNDALDNDRSNNSLKYLPLESEYFNIYVYSCFKKYNMDRNYEFIKNLEEAINIEINKYITSVQVSAVMTTAAWHNLYSGNPNFYQDFTTRIYNSILQLNAKEMRLFSKRHVINKENPYVQNRDSISGRTLRNLTHNLHTLLSYLLNTNDKVDYMGIRSNTKKYETYGTYNKKIGLLVGTLVNRISEFSSVVSNNEKTIVGIKNRKFLVEKTIEIGNRALSQVSDKGLRIKIQSLIEGSKDSNMYQHTVDDKDYVVIQNYFYTASVYKVVLISVLTYIDAMMSENPNEVDYNYIKEDYYRARYELAKEKLQNAYSLLMKNFDKFYDDSPWSFYNSFPMGSLSNSFVVRDSYVNKKDYMNSRDHNRKRDEEKSIDVLFEEMAKKHNREYDRWAYFREYRKSSSNVYEFIGVTNTEETDFVRCALQDLLDDDLMELHEDNNEIDIFAMNFRDWRNQFDTDIATKVDIKNIPVNLQNNELTAMESIDISLNFPLLLQSLENVVYENTADPEKKTKFLKNLATLDAAYYNYMKKDIAEYEKR